MSQWMVEHCSAADEACEGAEGDTSARDTHPDLLGDGRKDVNIIFLWRRDGHFPNFAWLSKGSKRDLGG